MKHFLIYGIQTDNGHEYPVFSVISRPEVEPDTDSCFLKLEQDHLFGYVNQDDIGDDQTAIIFDHVKEITPEDFETLKRLRVIF